MVLKMNRSLKKKKGIDKGGLGHADPEMREGGGRQSPKKFFSALQVLIWPTNKGGPGTFPVSATERFSSFKTGRPAREPLGERAKT